LTVSKIKLTKTELKKQRDALQQFSRFLPTLQLKKQQLQLEMRSCLDAMEKNKEKEAEIRGKLSSWIELFGPSDSSKMLASYVKIKEVLKESGNIAGVEIPLFKDVIFETADYDFFKEEPWIDDAIIAIKKVIILKIEHEIIQEQYRRIGHELRVTTQRVNLFEKVKIPECRGNIKRIQIYLGDMDVAGVGRAKIAKGKTQESAA